MNDDLKNALEKVLEVIIPYDIAREEERKQFNILKAMRSSSDEVRLHSRIIASLLDPNAPHDLGREPLKLFLECIEAKYIDKIIDKHVPLEILPNYRNKKEFKKMDILIRTDEYAVLIENKIWAGDSNKAKDVKYDKGEWKRKGQLERYYALLVKEGNHVYGEFEEYKIQVFYLTADGHHASDISTGAIRPDNDELKFTELPNKVKEINYRDHILKWLGKVERLDNINPTIRTLIKQYIMAVNELTDVTERIKIVNAIGSLSDQERVALASLFDSKKQKHISWHIADLFFQELYKMITEAGLLPMYVEKNNLNEEPKSFAVKDIYESMPQILNETKSDVKISFKNSQVLTFNKGVVEIDHLKIDFNDLTCVDTINISNADKRKEKVKEVFEKMKGK